MAAGGSVIEDADSTLLQRVEGLAPHEPVLTPADPQSALSRLVPQHLLSGQHWTSFSDRRLSQHASLSMICVRLRPPSKVEQMLTLDNIKSYGSRYVWTCETLRRLRSSKVGKSTGRRRVTRGSVRPTPIAKSLSAQGLPLTCARFGTFWLDSSELVSFIHTGGSRWNG